MKAAQIRANLRLYRDLLESSGMEPEAFPPDKVLSAKNYHWESLQHVLAMIARIENYMTQNRMDLALREYGFIQGVLWTTHLRSLSEIRIENKK